MGFFTKLGQIFTGSEQTEKATSRYPSEEYKGFTITPQPIAAQGQFRVAAVIEKTLQGEVNQHQFIRSDTCISADQAAELSLSKCKVCIDQMGDNIFS
jgi:hypothetical protein